MLSKYFMFFLCIRLSHADPLNGFIQVGVDAGVLHTYILPGTADQYPQLGGNNKHDRYCNNNGKTKFPVDEHQDNDNSQQLHAVDHDVDRTIGEQILQ